MRISLTLSKTKARKTSGLHVGADALPDKLSGVGERNSKLYDTTGTFVYLKPRRGMKSGSTQKSTE